MQREFGPCVYLLASRRRGALYVGVTSNLMQRVYQHREGVIPGFTRKYGIKMLVWFEPHATMEHAIVREKRLKKWNRARKNKLVETRNPSWEDLYQSILP